MHLKREKTPKLWPIKRKGTAYVVRSNFNLRNGIPILILLRDLLKIARNRKEIRKAIQKKQIMLNDRIISDEKNCALLFDTITIIPSQKNYRIALSEKGKFRLEEITKSKMHYKIAKVVNKKILKGKKMQLNLSDGYNILSETKCNINDSILINLEKKKIEKCLPLKEKAKILIFSGKHIGQKGIINKINKESKIVEVTSDEKIIHVLIKQLMVIE